MPCVLWVPGCVLLRLIRGITVLYARCKGIFDQQFCYALFVFWRTIFGICLENALCGSAFACSQDHFAHSEKTLKVRTELLVRALMYPISV